MEGAIGSISKAWYIEIWNLTVLMKGSKQKPPRPHQSHIICYNWLYNCSELFPNGHLTWSRGLNCCLEAGSLRSAIIKHAQTSIILCKTSCAACDTVGKQTLWWRDETSTHLVVTPWTRTSGCFLWQQLWKLHIVSNTSIWSSRLIMSSACCLDKTIVRKRIHEWTAL